MREIGMLGEKEGRDLCAVATNGLSRLIGGASALRWACIEYDEGGLVREPRDLHSRADRAKVEDAGTARNEDHVSCLCSKRIGLRMRRGVEQREGIAVVRAVIWVPVS